MQEPLAAGAAVAAGPVFTVPLTVLVVNDQTDAQHCGTLQLPRRALPAPPAPVPPSAAVLARLDPLLRAHGDARAAQTGGLDPERRSRTYAVLMAELQEAVGMRVDAELTPESLRAVLPGGGEEEEGEDEMESENGDDGRAQLAELPEGLRTLAGELRALKVQSTRLAKVPAWVGELSQLEALELDGRGDEETNIKLRTLPAEIGQLGTLKHLTLRGLDKLEAMPDTLGSLTSLESLTIGYCRELKTLPASIGQVGTLKQLTLEG